MDANYEEAPRRLTRLNCQDLKLDKLSSVKVPSALEVLNIIKKKKIELRGEKPESLPQTAALTNSNNNSNHHSSISQPEIKEEDQEEYPSGFKRDISAKRPAGLNIRTNNMPSPSQSSSVAHHQLLSLPRIHRSTTIDYAESRNSKGNLNHRYNTEENEESEESINQKDSSNYAERYHSEPSEPYTNAHRYNSSMKEVSEEEDEEMPVVSLDEAFKQALAKIPRLTKFRNAKNLEEFVRILKETNPFFKNLSEILISSLLKVAKIKVFPKGERIYNRADKLTSVFIILWGKVRVSDMVSDFRKISLRGETLSEHLIFDPMNTKFRFQNAKAVSEATVLELPIFVYKKVYEELALYGYRGDFLAMESLMKRNYIFKQSLKSK